MEANETLNALHQRLKTPKIKLFPSNTPPKDFSTFPILDINNMLRLTHDNLEAQ